MKMKADALMTWQHKCLLIILAIATLGVFFLTQTPDVPDAQPVDAQKADPVNTVNPPKMSVPEENKTVINAVVNAEQKKIPPKPVVTIESGKNTWAIGNAKSALPSMPLPEKVVAYEPIEINQHPETLPQVGEQISLPMLNGKTVVVDVQSTTINPNGDHTWSGHVQGHGDDYPVVMTYGEHAIFAMITTPEGSYSMASVDGSGWLYKNPSEFELSTPGTKDYVEVNAADLHK